jgi:Zn-dependent peptidase ImmA (M78 family)/transcriptional regulator with XRE-family HTH domain
MADASKIAIGRNLKTARDAAQLSQEQLANLLGVSRATLSYIENGHATIDSTKLLEAAKILRRPVTFFFEDTDGECEFSFLYRAGEDVTPSGDVLQRFQRFCESYQYLEEVIGVAGAVLAPPEYSYSHKLHANSWDLAEQVATSERQRLGLGQSDTIENIFELLDENGVRILDSQINDEDVFGLSACSRNYGLCILVNTANTLERNIFTAGHEYGHLLMHRGFYSVSDPDTAPPRDTILEKMADAFAACFLVPAAGLRELCLKSVGKEPPGLEDVVFLKRHFKVSAKMMIRRLLDVGIVSAAAQEELQKELERKEPDPKKEFAPMKEDLIGAWKKVRRFEHLARKALLSKAISIGKLAELLGVKLIEAMELASAWREEMSLEPV